MVVIKCPSVPILGDQLNPINAIVFSSVMIISVVFLPSIHQSAILAIISFVIILVSIIVDLFGFINKKKLPKKEESIHTEENIISNNSKIDSLKNNVNDNEKHDYHPVEEDHRDQILNSNKHLQMELKAKTSQKKLIPIPGNDKQNTITTTSKSPNLRPFMGRSSSTCEYSYRGLGGWSPSLYLSRFGRFQILEQPSGRIIPPNAREILHFENEYFVGDILIMIKTTPTDEVKKYIKTRLPYIFISFPPYL